MAELIDFQDKLKALSEAYAAELPGKIQQIEAAWRELARGEWDEAGFKSLHRMVHSLTGSGKTFGFALLSDVARKLEMTLDGFAQAKTMPDEEQRNRIQMVLSEFHQAVKQRS
jgi:chemotaxis protein histidine kinase CheA